MIPEWATHVSHIEFCGEREAVYLQERDRKWWIVGAATVPTWWAMTDPEAAPVANGEADGWRLNLYFIRPITPEMRREVMQQRVTDAEAALLAIRKKGRDAGCELRTAKRELAAFDRENGTGGS